MRTFDSVHRMSDSVLDQAWSLTGDFAALKKMLGGASNKDTEIALALARFEVLDKDVGDSIAAEGSGAFVVPLALAQALAATEPRAVIASIESVFRVIDERAKPALRELATKCQAQASALQARRLGRALLATRSCVCGGRAREGRRYTRCGIDVCDAQMDASRSRAARNRDR